MSSSNEQTAILEGFGLGRHEVQFIKLYVGDHDGISGAVGGEEEIV